MNSWERNGKRVCKAFLWAPVYFFGALALDLSPSWQLLLLILSCEFWSYMLDRMMPTDESAVTLHVRQP